MHPVVEGGVRVLLLPEPLELHIVTEDGRAHSLQTFRACRSDFFPIGLKVACFERST